MVHHRCGTAAAPWPAPRAPAGGAGGGGASRLLRDTRAGELPRLTYTLFILTLASRAFVIFNEKLALHHHGEGVCQPGPLPKSCSPTPRAGQISRGAPLLRDNTPAPSTLSLSKPRAPLCHAAENGHSSCHKGDAPGLATTVPAPPAPIRPPVSVVLAGEPDTPALSRGAAVTRSLSAATLDRPAGHSSYSVRGEGIAAPVLGVLPVRHGMTRLAGGDPLLQDHPRQRRGWGPGPGTATTPLAPAVRALRGTWLHEVAFWGFLAAFLTALCLLGTSGSLGCACPAWAWVSAGVCRVSSIPRRLPALPGDGDALRRERKGFPLAPWRF